MAKRKKQSKVQKRAKLRRGNPAKRGKALATVRFAAFAKVGNNRALPTLSCEGPAD